MIRKFFAELARYYKKENDLSNIAPLQTFFAFALWDVINILHLRHENYDKKY